MKKYFKIGLIVAFFATLAACLEILNFTHPDSVPVNSEFEVAIDIKVNVDENIDRDARVLVGILAPVSWNITGNAVVTYSSADMPGGAVSNGTMRVATADDLNADKKTWVTALTEKTGYRGNYEPVEWVAFLSTATHSWPAGSEFTGTVNIKLTTGSENLKTYMSYFVGNSVDGVNDDRQYYLQRDHLFETTGGDGPTTDYTLPKLCTVTPEKFTWEDIVCFNYNATVQIDGIDSPLKDAEAVYFIATATYDNGAQSVTVDEINDKTRMWPQDTDKWFLWLYPHEYFGIPAGKKIDAVTFYITNGNRSVEVRMPDGEDFDIPENEGL